MAARFAITVFLGAGLLFAVQPMVGKLLLPLVGGAPAAWNTCMVFFQAGLLAGYAGAHAAASRLGPRAHVVAHLGVALAALAVLQSSSGRSVSLRPSRSVGGRPRSRSPALGRAA